MRKRLLVLGEAVLAVALIPAAAVLLLPGTPKTPFRAKYDRVRQGMTVEAVRAIMGKPLLSLLGFSDGTPDLEMYEAQPWGHGPTTRVFRESMESVSVCFTNGRVTRRFWHDGHEPTALESLLERFGW